MAPGGSTYVLTKWVFLRALGIIYLVAFASLWVQIRGLVGPHGILPAEQFLQAVRQHYGAERCRRVPTLLWLRSAPRAWHLASGRGVACGFRGLVEVWTPGEPGLLS